MNERVPYIIYESSLVRHDKTNKRLWILCIILIITLVLTNLAWVIYESQFETIEKTYAEIEQQADGDSNNYIIGGNYGGETENSNNQN